MRRQILFSFLIAASGCTASLNKSDTAGSLNSFADSPTKTVAMTHNIRHVTGEVQHFQSDGTRVTLHGLPLAMKVDRSTYAISILPKFDTAGDISAEDLRALVGAAETFCNQTGYVRVDDSIFLQNGKDSLLLIEFCVPAGVKLPPFYKAGDRVPRTN